MREFIAAKTFEEREQVKLKYSAWTYCQLKPKAEAYANTGFTLKTRNICSINAPVALLAQLIQSPVVKQHKCPDIGDLLVFKEHLPFF